MLLLFYYLPFLPIDVWEEGVCFFSCFFYEGEIEIRGQGQSFMVDASAADDEDILTVSFFKLLQGICEGGTDEAAFYLSEGMAQNNILAAWQGSVGKRFVGLPSHDDGMAESKLFEVVQVFRQMPEQMVLVAYGTVTVKAGYDG